MSDRIPTSMPTDNRPGNLGASMDDDTSRLDAVAKVTGAAKYSRDRYLPNSLYAAFIRCPVGAGTLETIDEAAAQAVPGVVEVSIEGGEGRYEGHDIGYLVAESKMAMVRGMRALAPKWSRQPVRTRIIDGETDLSPSPSAETTSLLERADHVLEAVYSTPSQTHSCLETHGSVVDHRGDRATAYVSTQGTFAAREGMSQALELPDASFEIVCEYIGGGFGSKLNGAGKEGATAARIAGRYKRPVYLFVDRAEEHLDTGNRPSSRTLVRVGYRNDGSILGGQIETWGGVGVSRGGGGVSIPSRRYELGELQRNHQNVQLNAGSPRPFRAPGAPQGAFAEELMLDEIATSIDMDPLELRAKLDRTDERRAMYREGARLIGWSDRRATGSQTGAVRRGMGVGSTSWGRFPSRAEGEVVINPDGSVEARTGTQDIGTGQRTIMGIVAARAIGIDLDHVRVAIGSSRLPVGPASGGSVTAHNTVPAMRGAAEDARTQLLEFIAGTVGGDAESLEINGGRIQRGGTTIMSWSDACAALPAGGITGRGRWNRNMQQRDDSRGHSYGVQFVDLHVDVETGVVGIDRVVAIQSCGAVVCRKTAESQIIGGVIQGLSYALFEDKVLDRNVGAMVNPNLEQYKVLGTADMPHIEPVLWSKGQDGVRSLGEPPTIPTAGATACALFNALGVPIRDLPLTPPRILAALEGGAA